MRPRADKNNRGRALFGSARVQAIPRPRAWRVIGLQACALPVVVAIAGLWHPGALVSVLAAGVLAMAAHAYFTWRSLRYYGTRHSALFVLGASRGLFGKWIIVTFGLVLLWRTGIGPEVPAMLLTVFVINTLAVASAPFLVK